MDLREQKFGVEVEFTGITRETSANILKKYLNGRIFDETNGYKIKAEDGREWQVVYDGSITGQKRNRREEKVNVGESYKVEFVTPICRYDDIEKIQEIVRLFREKGAFVNKSCGIHIHINAEPFTASKIRNLVNIIASKEDLIYKALKVDKNRENKFCKKIDKVFLKKLNEIKPKQMEELERLWYDGESRRYNHYHSSRYHCLNLHSVFGKGTIEIRAFNGNIHAGKLKAYIQLCLAMTARAYNMKFASPKRTITSNEKYNFRVWLLSLEMIGDEYKTARKHLLDHLEGNIAWKDPAQAERQKERIRVRNEENRQNNIENDEIADAQRRRVSAISMH